MLIGGGGHCKSVLDAAVRMKKYSEIVITDSIDKAGSTILNHRIVGDDAELPLLKQQGFSEAFVTVGSIESVAIRKKLVQMALALDFSFPVIIDPSAIVSEYAIIGSGTFVGKNTVVNADAIIGNQCIINTGSIIEHDCIIGDYSHVAVGATLCGNVRIGEDSFVGAGSTIIQGVSVGNRAIIGANSTVITDVMNDEKVCGLVKNSNPSQVIK